MTQMTGEEHTVDENEMDMSSICVIVRKRGDSFHTQDSSHRLGKYVAPVSLELHRKSSSECVSHVYEVWEDCLWYTGAHCGFSGVERVAHSSDSVLYYVEVVAEVDSTVRTRSIVECDVSDLFERSMLMIGDCSVSGFFL
ncbi:hypothetical protein Tco_0811026 [Tanacetum coccineum]